MAVLGQPWSSVVARILPPGTLSDPPEDPPPIHDSSLTRRLLDSFARLFESLSREGGTILLIDDLQWADQTTVGILQFIQRRWSGDSFGIVATLRPELVRSSDAVAQYLTGASGILSHRVELVPFSGAEAHKLIDALAATRVSDAIARRLSTIAGCHPLYLTELTREYVRGRLQLPMQPSDELVLPTSLEKILGARLDLLSGDALRVASVLAVAGGPLKNSALAELLDLSPDAITGALERLANVSFVSVDRLQACVAHELFRRAIYARLSEPRRTMYHRRLATWLHGSGEETAGEAAIHYARAGEPRLAAQHGWRAARRALEAGALAEAIQFLEIVAESEGDPAQRAHATADLARALYLARDISRANPWLGLAATRLRAIGEVRDARQLEIRRIEGLAEVDAEAVGVLLPILSIIKRDSREAGDWESLALALDTELHLLHREGDVSGIASLLQEMKAVARLESSRARLLAYAGLALGVFFADPEEALGAAKEALELAPPGHSYRLRALHRLTIVLQARGMLTLPDAAAYVDEARQIAERCGDLLMRFSIESNLAAAHLDAGDLARAEALMARVDRIAGTGEMDLNRFIQANNEAELALARCEFEAGADAYRRAEGYLSLATPSYMADLVNAGLGYCALETGNLAEARRREGMLHEAPASWYFDPTTILTFRARLLERRGQPMEAITLLADSAADLRGRLTLAWLKVAAVQVRLMVKVAPAAGGAYAAELMREASRLQLVHRAREFEALQEVR